MLRLRCVRHGVGIDVLFRARAGKVRGKARAELLVELLRVRHAGRRVLPVRLRLGRERRLRRDDGRHDERVRHLVALHIIDQRLLQLRRGLEAILRTRSAGLQDDGSQLIIGIDRRRHGLAGQAELVRHGLARGLVFKRAVVAVIDAVEQHADGIQVDRGVWGCRDGGKLRRGIRAEVILRHRGILQVLQRRKAEVPEQEPPGLREEHVLRLEVFKQIARIAAGRERVAQVDAEIHGAQAGHGAVVEEGAQRDHARIEDINIVADAALLRLDLVRARARKIAVLCQTHAGVELVFDILGNAAVIGVDGSVIRVSAGEDQRPHLQVRRGDGDPLYDKALARLDVAEGVAGTAIVPGDLLLNGHLIQQRGDKFQFGHRVRLLNQELKLFLVYTMIFLQKMQEHSCHILRKMV